MGRILRVVLLSWCLAVMVPESSLGQSPFVYRGMSAGMTYRALEAIARQVSSPDAQLTCETERHSPAVRTCEGYLEHVPPDSARIFVSASVDPTTNRVVRLVLARTVPGDRWPTLATWQNALITRWGPPVQRRLHSYATWARGRYTAKFVTKDDDTGALGIVLADETLETLAKRRYNKQHAGSAEP
jgi:hypothetical protein